MNLMIICSGCGAVYRVFDTIEGGDNEQLIGPLSEWWPDKYTCPRCGAQAAGAEEALLPRSVQTSDIVDLTPIEMFSALNGFGLPEELPTSVENLTEVLRSSAVKRVVGSNVPNTKRCVVDFIELESGVKVYFGASTHGAVAYRVVRPTSYAQRVIKEEEERGSHL